MKKIIATAVYFLYLIATVQSRRKRKREPVVPVEQPICNLCTCLNGTANLLTNDDGSDVGIVIQCAMKALSFTTLEHTIFPEKIHSLDFRFQGLSTRQSPDMFVR